MPQVYVLDQTFEKINDKNSSLQKGDYECCTFKNCDFSSSDLSKNRFVDCEFINCDLSSANINDVSLQNVRFSDCKLLGLHFENCNEFNFEVEFHSSLLDHSSFYGVNMSKTSFRSSSLKEVDFTETNLDRAVLDDCNLLGTAFERSILTKADFRTSYSYTIDPENNQIKGAKFSQPEVIGLLNKYQIIIE